MSIGFRSLLAWAALFLSAELAAHFHLSRWQAALCVGAAAALTVGLWPIVTLSATVWDGEAFWPVVMGVYVAAFMFVLLGHFELHWSARWVIAAGATGALLVASRLMERVLP